MPEDTPRSDWDFNAERFASAQPTGSSTPEREAVASSETIRKAKSRGSRYSEIGSSGLKETGGFIHEEFLPALRGPKGDAVWREMQDNDPVIGGILHGIEMLARKVEWQVDPAEPAEVEEIVAQRQKERANAMAAAEAQAQAQAEREAAMQESMVAQADAAKQTSASSVKKDKGHTRANTPSAGQQVAKALTALGADPSLHHGSLARLDAAIADLGRATASRAALRDRQLDAHIEAWSARLAKAAGDGEGPSSDKGPAKESKKKGPKAKTSDSPAPSPSSFMEAAALEGEEDAVFVETCIHDMHPGWESTLSEILTFLPYGWSFHEIVYKRRQGNRPTPQKSSMFNDGMVGWSGLPGRAQETRWRWEFGPNGEIEGMHQMDPYRGGRNAFGATPNTAFGATSSVYIPMTKALLFRTTAKRNNPEGRSVLRNAYRPWYMKKRIEEIEAIGIERDLAGFPVAYVPYHWMTDTATDSEAAALDEIKNIVRNIKRDEQEGAVFPRLYEPESNNPLFELELLSTGGSRQFDTSEIISRYDKRIAMTVLADFILLGQDNVGSFALGKTKVDLFTAALEAWMDAIAEVFNVDAIPRLMKVNGKDPAAAPVLAHGTMSQVDLVELGDFLQKLSQAGAPLFPDDNLESYIRQAAGLPDIEAGNPDLE